MSKNFYASFEDKYRGSRELIKSRLKAYLPFIEPLLHLYPKGALVDLGCGRGEWLELTAETGFQPLGVDIDDGMLRYAQELGLPVQKMDALVFLKQLPDCSQTIVSGFHIVEHIAFEQLQQLVQEAKRVLVPGGLLILETPNPENLMVGTSSFYLDPTHQRPIPPDLLHFLTEYYGYSRQKIIRLQEPQHLINSAQATLMDVVGGVSPDYSVIAQTAATSDILQAFDTPFNQNYGLTLQALAERFQQNVTSQLDFAERTAKSQLQEALQVAQTAQQQMLNALDKAEQAEALVNSQSQERQNIETQLAAALQRLHDELARAEQAEALVNSQSQERQSIETQLAAALQELHDELNRAEQAEALASSHLQSKQRTEVELAAVQQDGQNKEIELATALQKLHNELVRAEQAEALASSYLQGKQRIEAELAVVQQEMHTTRQSYYDQCLLIEEQSRYLHDLYRSRFWRMTLPLRWVFGQMRQLRAVGLKARIRAAARKTAQKVNHKAYMHPALRRLAIACSRMLGVDTFLRRLLIKPQIQPIVSTIQFRADLIETRLGEKPGLAKEDLELALQSNSPGRKRSVDEIHARISAELRQTSENQHITSH